MSKIKLQSADLQKLLESLQDPVIAAKKIDCPFTTIINREKIIDPANDLGVRWGTKRVATATLVEKPDESGPNGEQIYGIANDPQNLVRFVGKWIEHADNFGAKVRGNSTNDYIEITFYGTGINLFLYTPATFTFSYSIDGGSTQNFTLNAANPLFNREYTPYVPYTVVKGLSLGVHTIKIDRGATTDDFSFWGFEVLNESSNLHISAGEVLVQGERRVLASPVDTPYNSEFDSESDPLGTKGGRVIVYLDKDGSVKKRFKATDSNVLYGSNADHSNEEIIREYWPREFGTSMTNDFSIVAQSANPLQFTLSDNTTTLNSQSTALAVFLDHYTVYPYPDGNSVQFTFVGTGLDILNGYTVVQTPEVYIDDVLVTPVDSTTGDRQKIIKLASGLPFGTHTVRMVRSNLNTIATVSKFITYGPKTPDLPEGAVKLAEYFIPADFSPLSSNSLFNQSTGVIRKTSFREWFTSGSWYRNENNSISFIGGGVLETATNNNYAEYSFFGTGFDLRAYSSSSRGVANVTLNGLTLTSGNYPTATFGTYGAGVSFNSSTGVYSQNLGTTTLGSGFYCYGLPLGWYTVRFTKTGGTFLTIDAIDVIVPSYARELNIPNRNNNLDVPATIRDLRKFSRADFTPSNIIMLSKRLENVSQTISTTGYYTPAKDLSSSFYLEKDSTVRISALYTISARDGKTLVFYFFIDGKLVNITADGNEYFIGTPGTSETRIIVPPEYTLRLKAGYHHILPTLLAASTSTINYIYGSRSTVKVEILD